MTETPPPYVTGARVYPVREHTCECGALIGVEQSGPDGKPVLIRHGDKVLYIDFICQCGKVIHWGRQDAQMRRLTRQE